MKSFYEGQVWYFNFDKDDHEEWDVVIDTENKEFYFIYGDYDYTFDFINMPKEFKQTIGANTETSRYIINGIFKIIGDK